jgi:putative Holliday junction resolvase
MRTIAFDVGTVRVGVAISDPDGIIATPLRMVERTENAETDVRTLAEIATTEQAQQILVGMPVSLRGKREIAAQHMEAFIALLRGATSLPVIEWDERMTTAIATRALVAGEMNWRARRTRVDQVAATVLLQSFLDARPAGSHEPSGPPRDAASAGACGAEEP